MGVSTIVSPYLPINRRPSGLVGNLHTCSCGSREFDSCQRGIFVLSNTTVVRSGKRENVSK